jgi:hypothetical protein
VSRANAMSESLAATLLQRVAPGSVDFSRGTYSADNGRHCEP